MKNFIPYSQFLTLGSLCSGDFDFSKKSNNLNMHRAIEYYETHSYLLSITLYIFLNQVFKSDDPLDSKDFNPVDYINSVFPTEQVCLIS